MAVFRTVHNLSVVNPGRILGRPTGAGAGSAVEIPTNVLLSRQGTGGGLYVAPANTVLANLTSNPAVPVPVPFSLFSSSVNGGLGTVTIITQTTDVYLM